MNWKAVLFLLSLFLLVFFAGWFMNRMHARPANNVARDPAHWTPSSRMDAFNKPVVMAAGQGLTWYELPKGASYFPVIYLEAKFPVTVSFIPEKNVDIIDKPSSKGLAIHTCEQEHKQKTIVMCDLDTTKEGWVFYIHDDRQVEENTAPNEIYLNYRSLPKQ